MDVLNEVSFLKNIEKTPSFLVYSRKRKTFTPVEMKLNGQIDENNNDEMIKYLNECI